MMAREFLYIEICDAELKIYNMIKIILANVQANATIRFWKSQANNIDFLSLRE